MADGECGEPISALDAPFNALSRDRTSMFSDISFWFVEAAVVAEIAWILSHMVHIGLMIHNVQ